MKTLNEPKETNKTGKEFELRFLHELYEHIRKKKIKCDVFQPIVDDNGIDYVIRTASGKYIEIQIKARTEKHIFTITKDFKTRQNYWFIFYCGYEKDRYILSSKNVAKMLTDNNHIYITKDMEKYKKLDFGCFFSVNKNR